MFFDGRTQQQQKDNPVKLSEGAEQFFVIPPLTAKTTKCRVYFAKVNPTFDTYFVGRRTKTGYLIEGKIKPNKRSFFKIVPGQKFGLDIAIDDSDELSKAVGKRKTQLMMYGTGFNHKDTSKWGRFILFSR